MTAPPPHPPTEPRPEEPAPPARTSLVGEAIAWLVIVLITLGVPLAEMALERRQAAATATQPAPPGPDMQFEINGRYVIGAREILQPMGEWDATKTSQLFEQVEKQANNPAEELRLAVVSGEFYSEEAALARLDAVLAEPDLHEQTREDAAFLREVYRRPETQPTATIEAIPDAEARQRLGWFGQLAESHGLPDSDARRRGPLLRAQRTAIAAIAFGCFAFMLLAGGFVLLLLAAVFFAAGKLRPMYRPDPPVRAPRGVFVEGFALYLIVHVGMSIGLALAMPKLGLAGLLLLFVTVPIVLTGLRARGVTWAELRQGMGWHAERGWLREIGWGLVGYVAGLPLVLVGFLLMSLLMRFSTEPPSHPVLEWAREPGLWRPIQIYLLACVLAPLVEETMFRGVLFHYLRMRWSFLPSAVLVALIFAALHPQGWTAIPLLGSLAVVFAALREWRGSLIAPIAAHALNNGAAVTLLMLMAR